MRSLLFVGQSVRVKSKALVMEEFVCLRKERLRERERERESTVFKILQQCKKKGLEKRPWVDDETSLRIPLKKVFQEVSSCRFDRLQTSRMEVGSQFKRGWSPSLARSPQTCPQTWAPRKQVGQVKNGLPRPKLKVDCTKLALSCFLTRAKKIQDIVSIKLSRAWMWEIVLFDLHQSMF